LKGTPQQQLGDYLKSSPFVKKELSKIPFYKGGKRGIKNSRKVPSGYFLPHPLLSPSPQTDCVIFWFFVAADFSLRKPLVEFQQLTQSKDCGYNVKT